MATDHVTDLKLGITQEEFLKKTETHLETLYEQNVAQGTAITSAQTKAEEAIAAAQGKTKGIVYATLSAMVTGLRSKARTDLNVGDNIYITAIDVPDFWVAEVANSQNGSNDENNLIINNYNNTQIGYFVISKLETQKAVITNMVETDNDLPANQIVLGAGNRKVNGSGYTIIETAPSEDSDHTTVPTSKAVSDSILAVAQPAATAISALETAVSAIPGTYATKEDLKGAGKVKKITLNNEELDISDGNAKINIKVNNNLVNVETDDDGQYINIVAQAEGQETTPLEATLTPINTLYDIEYDNVWYKAIKLDAKIVVTGVFNSEKKLIITQPVVVTESDVNYIYYLVALKDGFTDTTFYYQTIEGNAVGGGSVDSSEIANIKQRLSSLEQAAEYKSYFYEHTVRLRAYGFSTEFENQTWDNSEVFLVIKYISLYQSTPSDWSLILSQTPFIQNNTNAFPLSVMGYVTLKQSNSGVAIQAPIVNAYINNKTVLCVEYFVNSATTFAFKGENLSTTGAGGSTKANFTIIGHTVDSFAV